MTQFNMISPPILRQVWQLRADRQYVKVAYGPIAILLAQEIASKPSPTGQKQIAYPVGVNPNHNRT